MQTTSPRRFSDRPVWRAVSEAFWLIDLAAVVLFVFFLALGAFGLGDMEWVAGAVAVLAVAYVAHLVLLRRHASPEQRRAAVRARERRGF